MCLSLIEKAEQSIDQDKAKEMEQTFKERLHLRLMIIWNIWVRLRTWVACLHYLV